MHNDLNKTKQDNRLIKDFTNKVLLFFLYKNNISSKPSYDHMLYKTSSQI